MSRLPAKDPTLIQVLSLYLLLLAFFVLLFNASRYDRGRADAVTESLSSTFRMHGDLAEPATVRSSDLGQTPGNELVLTDVADLIRTELDVSKVEFLKRGRLLRATFVTSELFETGTSGIRSDRTELMRKLSALLTSQPKGQRHKVAVLVGSPWITPDQMKSAVPLSVDRAASFAQMLIENGALKGTVASGVEFIRPESVTFTYRIDPETRPEDAAPAAAGSDAK